MSTHEPDPSDVTDDEWPFVAPYLTLTTQDAPQRQHPTREVFNGLRWVRPKRVMRRAVVMAQP